jgi:hypothetical protein
VLDPQAVVQGEAIAEAPVVLHVGPVVLREPLERPVVERRRTGVGDTEQNAREFVAADAPVAGGQAIEIKPAAHRRVRHGRHAHPPHVGAELQAVGAHQLRQRAVDRVRALPAVRDRAPAADVSGRIVEPDVGEHVFL